LEYIEFKNSAAVNISSSTIEVGPNVLQGDGSGIIILVNGTVNATEETWIGVGFWLTPSANASVQPTFNISGVNFYVEGIISGLSSI
jgi:hypothetical protein